MTEEQLEQETLAWLEDVGYTHRYGPDIAFDGSSPERADYRQVVLPFLKLPLEMGVLSFVQNVDKELRNGGKASTCGIHAGI